MDNNTNNVKKSSILVTGASGFLGPRVCLALISEGYDVIALSRPKSSKVKNIPHGVKILEVDFVNSGEYFLFLCLLFTLKISSNF